MESLRIWLEVPGLQDGFEPAACSAPEAAWSSSDKAEANRAGCYARECSGFPLSTDAIFSKLRKTIPLLG